MGRKTVDGGFEPGMDAELAILAAIESRYNEELAKLERSPKPPDDKERLRQQLVEALSAIATCSRQGSCVGAHECTAFSAGGISSELRVSITSGERLRSRNPLRPPRRKSLTTGDVTVDKPNRESYIEPVPPKLRDWSPENHETFNATVHGRDQEQEAGDIAGDGLIVYSST